MNLVFTQSGLTRILEHLPMTQDILGTPVPADGAWRALSVSTDGTTYCATADDTEGSARIVIMKEAVDGLGTLDIAGRRSAFERMLWISRAAERPPVRLPLSWREFHDRNLLAYFACSRNLNTPSSRWIAEIRPLQSMDVVYWQLTTREEQQALREFAPPHERYRAAVRAWSTAIGRIRSDFSRLPQVGRARALQDAVDLDAAVIRPITQHRTYSQWLSELTPSQREFLGYPTDRPVKLRGPAGSGKTLSLMLKALRELYDARAGSSSIRILFATHSWAAAEQVQRALDQLNEQDPLAEVDVYPLLQVAHLLLPEERSARDFETLGEDSLVGKLHQLRRIDATVERLATGEWLALRATVSPTLRARVEAPHGSPERNAFVWDLMIEFSSVLASHGILPGLSAERRYLAVRREAWMMPLETDGDKLLVLRVYSDYVDGLRQDGLITSDQVITDFLSYLETFAWNLRRERDGYDLICVDEFQLFNEQERLVLQYLNRSAGNYPRLLLAMDPRQAPYEAFPEFGIAPDSERNEAPGTVPAPAAAVDLTTTFRFSPQILELVRHVQRSYPALSLGDDWRFRVEDLRTTNQAGAVPLLHEHRSRSDEQSSVLERATRRQQQSSRDERVAVIAVDIDAFAGYEAAAARLGGFLPLRSRDDGMELRYSRRAIVLATAESAAGLQFDHVLVGGLPHATPGDQLRPYELRRVVSLLYMAISRASKTVEINVNDQDGGTPDFLASAVSSGYLRRVADAETAEQA